MVVCCAVYWSVDRKLQCRQTRVYFWAHQPRQWDRPSCVYKGDNGVIPMELVSGTMHPPYALSASLTSASSQAPKRPGRCQHPTGASCQPKGSRPQAPHPRPGASSAAAGTSGNHPRQPLIRRFLSMYPTLLNVQVLASVAHAKWCIPKVHTHIPRGLHQKDLTCTGMCMNVLRNRHPSPMGTLCMSPNAHAPCPSLDPCVSLHYSGIWWLTTPLNTQSPLTGSTRRTIGSILGGRPSPSVPQRGYTCSLWPLDNHCSHRCLSGPCERDVCGHALGDLFRGGLPFLQRDGLRRCPSKEHGVVSSYAPPPAAASPNVSRANDGSGDSKVL